MSADSPESGPRPLILPFRRPFHRGAMLAAMATHDVPGVEKTDLETCTHWRATRTPDGPSVVRVTLREDHVSVSTEPSVEDAAWLAASVRRWLDLDADPAAIERALGGDPLVGPLIRAGPGLRVLGYLDPFEGAIMTVMGQQVSLAATRTFGGRLVAAFGTPVSEGYSVYPTARELASSTPEDVQRAVGLTTARAATVVRLAEAFAAGLTLGPNVDRAAVRSALAALPGIGPWTVDYLSVRALGDRDAFVPGDLLLRRALGVESVKEAAAMSEAWRPYRAYALFHLWTNAAYAR
ncbi:MAG TPA: AlkA N-terminal domain-containing protein [Trueperaceae bacterium]|nr:AlkA N-terminal domain-containing protein [Trueperaceae bacterium]